MKTKSSKIIAVTVLLGASLGVAVHAQEQGSQSNSGRKARPESRQLKMGAPQSGQSTAPAGEAAEQNAGLIGLLHPGSAPDPKKSSAGENAKLPAVQTPAGQLPAVQNTGGR